MHYLLKYIEFLFTSTDILVIIIKPVVDMAKLVNAPDCGSGTREFKSRYPPQVNKYSRHYDGFSFAFQQSTHIKTLFKFYRGKSPAITWGGVWHQSQTPPLTLLRGIIQV